MSELGRKIDDSQKFMQETLLDLNKRVDKLDKGKGASHAYSTKDLNPNPPVAPTNSNEVEYGMPPNSFAGRSPLPGIVWPPRAEPDQPAASAGQIDT